MHKGVKNYISVILFSHYTVNLAMTDKMEDLNCACLTILHPK